MNKEVGVFEARRHFYHLLDEVAGGATIDIIKDGRRVAEFATARSEEA